MNGNSGPSPTGVQDGTEEGWWDPPPPIDGAAAISKAAADAAAEIDAVVAEVGEKEAKETQSQRLQQPSTSPLQQPTKLQLSLAKGTIAFLEEDEVIESDVDETRVVVSAIGSNDSSNLPSVDQVASVFVLKKKEFLSLCRTPFYYKRPGAEEQRQHAWDVVGENLEAIKKTDGLAKAVANSQDDSNFTALHYVCSGRPPIYVVESLLELSRQPLGWKDTDGNLPLHHAAQYGASFIVVKAVLLAYPEACNTANEAGRLPLLNAVLSNAQPNVVELLRENTERQGRQQIQHYVKHAERFLTLCCNLRERSVINTDWNKVRDELKSLQKNVKNPRLAEWIAQQVDDDEDTALHIICSCKPPLHLVKLFVEVLNTPLQMQNDWGGLPLHYAVIRGASDEVIRFLCNENPMAARIEDDYGSLPIHYALRHGGTDAVVNVLIEGNPEACRVKERNYGSLPLHIAILSGASNEVIKALVEEFPQAIRMKDNDGRLPIHHAVKNKSSRRLVEILENADPVEEETLRRAKEFLQLCYIYKIRFKGISQVDSEQLRRGAWEAIRAEIRKLEKDAWLAEQVASYCDGEGNTALHLVCISRPPLDIVRSLIKMSIFSIFRMKNKRGYLPLHCAIRHAASYEVIKALLQACPDTSKIENNQGKLPFQMAVAFNASDSVKSLLFDADRIHSKEIEDVSQRAREFRKLCTAARHENKRMGRGTDDCDEWRAVRSAVEELAKDANIAKRVAESTDNDSGMTALHILCGTPDLPASVVKTVTDMSNEPLRMRDKRDHFPLNIALKKGASDDVLLILLKTHPEDTKKGDLSNEGLESLRRALSSEACAEVIRELTDSVPVPFSADGISTLESLDLGDDQNETIHSWNGSINTENFVETMQQGPFAISQEKMTVLIESFLGECQTQKSKLDTELLDRFLTFLRKMPVSLKNDALAHPGFKHMLNEMVSRPFFTFALLCDFVAYIAIIVSFSLAAQGGHSDGKHQSENDLKAKGIPLGFLFFFIAYLIVRELVQILSLYADRVVDSWYKDFWNWLDVTYIILLLASAIEMGNKSFAVESVQTLVMVTGGLSWIMLLVKLKSAFLQFSVFLSALLNIVWKLVPFLITTFIAMEAFAFMYYIDSRNNPEVCPPTEIVIDESGNISEEESNETNFCTFRASQLKVFTMLVSIDSSDFTDGKAWLSIFFSFLFIVVLLNVLIAIVNDNWVDVQRQGRAVFWKDRYAFVNEVDALAGWFKTVEHWAKHNGKKDARVPRKTFKMENSPSQGKWAGLRHGVRQQMHKTISLIRSVFRLVVGLVTLGLLWPDDIRRGLWSMEPEVQENGVTNENLREEMMERNAEIGAKLDSVQQDMDNLKKQLHDIQQIMMLLARNTSGEGTDDLLSRSSSSFNGSSSFNVDGA